MLKLALLISTALIGIQARRFKYAQNYEDLDSVVTKKLPVAIKSYHGRYLRSQEFHTDLHTIFQPHLNSWEKLNIERVGQRFAIRSLKFKTYLRGDQNGKRIFWVNYVKSWEQFSFINVKPGWWAIKSNYPSNHYLRHHKGRKSGWSGFGISDLADFVSWRKSWETFQIEVIPKIEEFDWHFEETTLVSDKPLFMGTITVANRCFKGLVCPNQSKTFEVEKSLTNSHTFSKTIGKSISKTTKFETDIPFVGKLLDTTVTTSSQEFTWGSSNEVTETFRVSDPCVAGSNMSTKCTSYVNRAEVEVPFTLYWTTGETTKGIYKGVTHYNGRTEVTSEPIK